MVTTLDTDIERKQFIASHPKTSAAGGPIVFIQPSKKPKVEGVRRVDPVTGKLGASIFTVDFPGTTFISIPRTTQLELSARGLESKTEREFAKKQREVMAPKEKIVKQIQPTTREEITTSLFERQAAKLRGERPGTKVIATSGGILAAPSDTQAVFDQDFLRSTREHKRRGEIEAGISFQAGKTSLISKISEKVTEESLRKEVGAIIGAELSTKQIRQTASRISSINLKDISKTTTQGIILGKTLFKEIKQTAPRVQDIKFERFTSPPIETGGFDFLTEFTRGRTLQEKVDISLEVGEGTVSFFEREGKKFEKPITINIPGTTPLGLPIGGAPITERLSKTFANIQISTARGFGTVFKGAKERPLLTAAELLAFNVGIGVGGRVVGAATGTGLRVGKGLVSTGAFLGFAGYKEIKDPGSLTTLPGFITTTTEFGTFALGAKGLGVAGKSLLFLSPKFIPFKVTTKARRPGRPGIEEIQFFKGSTRTVSGRKLALGTPGRVETLLQSTATTETQFFKPLARTRSLLGKAKIDVKASTITNVGIERVKFGEQKLFFFSRRETFGMFGEAGIQRLGQISRAVKIDPSGKLIKTPKILQPVKIVTEFPRRFSELALRGAIPTVLRLRTEITPFPKPIKMRIARGETGSNLRRTINRFIQTQPGKIFPGPRGSALGFGEEEVVAAVGTKLFRLRGSSRFTFDPEARLFTKVIDIGLKPGRAPRGRFNLLGRISNIANIAVTDLLGVSGPSGIGTSGFRIRSPPVKTVIPRLRVSPLIRTRVTTTDLLRGRQRVRVRERPRVRKRTRVRERQRERKRTRERERERKRTRERERVRERARERKRTRERQRERPRQRVRVRERQRQRQRIRLRGRPGQPPPPHIILRQRRGETKKKKKKKKTKRPTKFRPSVVGVLKGRGRTPIRLTGFEVRRPR